MSGLWYFFWEVHFWNAIDFWYFGLTTHTPSFDFVTFGSFACKSGSDSTCTLQYDFRIVRTLSVFDILHKDFSFQVFPLYSISIFLFKISFNLSGSFFFRYAVFSTLLLSYARPFTYRKNSWKLGFRVLIEGFSSHFSLQFSKRVSCVY